ncbi:MAG: bile acid:sodium symporter family protein [Flavobacteriaceae bacterium]|jgi:BASS family bile acid:Na+ symporter|nr:bile acid:sodium symporter family protein [Flavobacteriaceae bacterium]MBT3920818.1 bile acid:sodium symporter family protein [Flavobacteriaceae bacterium]MBT6705616.1 bile acid:sodium symporter family protein [Flavobacteriaceae bacterium]|tara:strand:+ start:1396 stop:2295 length:900 start_codon:yes stop_codon:yes gene_type:complete
MQQELDAIILNFDSESLFFLNLTLAVIMFGVALNITISDFLRIVKNPKSVLIGVLSQFILLPAFTFLLVTIIQPLPSIALGMFLVAACPGGNISNFMTHYAKGNAALSVSLTAISTLLAIVMTPLNFQLWSGLYGPTSNLINTISLSPLEMVKVISLLLGVPLILGMLVQNYSPKFALKTAPIFKIGSILFFMALIILALSKNIDIFKKYIHYVFIIVLVHNILALILGYSVASIAGLSKRNRRTLAIETGIQNSGLGLLLIFSFFNGLGGMAILAAFWGIWHIVSGLTIAIFWSKKRI